MDRGSLVGLTLAVAPARAGEVPHLLADINRERPAAAPFSDVVGFFEVGDRLFFSTANPDDDGILWSSDVTAASRDDTSSFHYRLVRTAGTHRLLDLQPGPGSSAPDGLVSAGGRVFFTADDGTTGPEPWALRLE